MVGTKVIEQLYKRRRLDHIIASRRQMLILLGLPENDIDAIIAEHSGEDQRRLTDDLTNERRMPLLERVTVYAPPQTDAAARSLFVVEKLSVVMGQHVETGDTLCELGDFGNLLIEGEAFERDLVTLRRAIDNHWLAGAALERRGAPPLELKDLPILYIAPQVDVEARSARFYVQLVNHLNRIDPASGDTSRLDWAFRPGQRMELHVPLVQFDKCLKVPVEAVARDGLDNYVFQVSGTVFLRRPVQVLQRDEDYAVLAETRTITEGVTIAATGAYQLQLALANKAAGPVHEHGHSHN